MFHWKGTRVIFVAMISVLSSCAPYFKQPVRIKESRLGAETAQYDELTSLPTPKEKIVVAVYKFRDQTGQYKPSDVGASWSTAVTQGSTSILLRALEESKWFVPIERESLANLLNERKIIRSSRATYGGIDEKSNDALLPPLLFAGILLEGGIISFDSNVLTGGAGARYFGAGASTQYREDRVTVYLRAVSTSNGKILKTVYTSKTILSQKIDVGVFRFVKIKRLLEAETGFTYNEPAEMAVKEAIEKAVVGLVIEGLQEKLWVLQNPEEIKRPIVQDYLFDKVTNKNIDAFDNELRPRRSKLGISAAGGGQFYNGDYSGTRPFAGGQLSVDFPADKTTSISLTAGAGEVGTRYAYRGSVAYADLSARYRFFNLTSASPYAKVGLGFLTETKNNVTPDVTFQSSYYGYAMGELGFEQLLNDNLGIFGAVSGRFLFSDRLDNVQHGRFNDIIWVGKIGVSFYIIR